MRLYLFFVLPLFVACSHAENNNESIDSNEVLTEDNSLESDTSIVLEEEKVDNVSSTDEDINSFNKNAVIQILSLKRLFDEEQYPELNELCSNWSIEKEDVLNMIKQSDFISGTDVQYLYSTLPCEYEGDLKIDEKEYYYNVNGGSYITLVGKDNVTIYMGCSQESCKEHFAMEGGKIEE